MSVSQIQQLSHITVKTAQPDINNILKLYKQDNVI